MPVTSAWSRVKFARNLDALLLIGVICWLMYAAIRVDIEYYDGFDAICNARHFLGQHQSGYLVTRAPLMAWLLIPAEWVKHLLHLHPLAVVPHHVTMALLHGCYLIGVYCLLVSFFGRSAAVLVGFAGAVLNFIFFSYAPFITHVIFPGLVFLLMLVQADRYLNTAQKRIWGQLVLLGALAPLLRQTYAMFWAALLAAYGIALIVRRNPDEPYCVRRFLHLCGGAVMSGFICWIVLGLALTSVYPERSLFLRPYLQTVSIWQERPIAELYPWWVYLRNIWAYGILTALLLIPGIGMALRGARLPQAIALAWLLMVGLMNWLPLKEVRYLDFLAPLSAFLIIPPLRFIRQSRAAMLLVLAVWGVDLFAIIPEIGRVATPFYTRSDLKAFLQPLEHVENASLPIYFSWPYVGFPAPDPSPLAGDRFHRIFHFGGHQLEMLYGYPPQRIIAFKRNTPDDLNQIQAKDALLIYANTIVMQSSAWDPEPALNLMNLQQFVAKYARLDLSKQIDGSFAAATGETLMFPTVSRPGETGLVIEGAFLSKLFQNGLWIDVFLPDERVGFPIKALNPQEGLIPAGSAAARLRAAPSLSIRSLTLKSLWKNNRLVTN